MRLNGFSVPVKRVTLFSGHYGSGKTNVAVNYAVKLKENGLDCAIIDLDIVNPYFRTKDSAERLKRAGVETVFPAYYTVEERLVSAEELFDAAKNGSLEEAWGTGTAAVISPIGKLYFKGEEHVINNNEIGAVTQKLYDDITAIQWGKAKDEFGWSVKVCD